MNYLYRVINMIKCDENVTIRKYSINIYFGIKNYFSTLKSLLQFFS